MTTSGHGPRYAAPAISMLLPSRSRAEALRESIAELLAAAIHPEAVEVLVAADPDDPQLAAMSRTVAACPQAHLWTAPERYGYGRLHEYYNALAGLARGEWLMIWNDDARMLTPAWDEVIRSEVPGILWPQSDYLPEIDTFPVIPSAWVRHLGHFSLDKAIDVWIHEIGQVTGTLRRIPVSIHHEHASGDLTADERDAVAGVVTFQMRTMVRARKADAAKITELVTIPPTGASSP